MAAVAERVAPAAGEEEEGRFDKINLHLKLEKLF
jgi:hypothetical protein